MNNATVTKIDKDFFMTSKDVSLQPQMIDMSNDAYHAHPALSRSALWCFKQLPYKYWYQYLSGQYERPEQTEALILGSLAHTMILEPELFASQYVVMPNIDRRTKAGKELYDDFLQKAEGKTLIKLEHYECAGRMMEEVYKNDTAKQILTKAYKEKSIFWKDPITGLSLKARPDAWNSPIVADVKTTNDASYRAFQIDAFKSGYFLQAAMQYEATKALGDTLEKFIFICVEKKPPYSVALYMLDDEAMQFGLDLMRKLLDDMARCIDANHWPDYGIQTLCIPRYATMELTNE